MSKPVAIYGIKNCDTMKKARAWLDAHGVAYAFHDYKAQGIERGRLAAWAHDVGWETLLNRAGTTFRKLPEKDKEGLDERKALALMLAQPATIKRPVLDAGGKLLVGFEPATYAGTGRGLVAFTHPTYVPLLRVARWCAGGAAIRS
jgi:arsenate reductase